MIVSFDSGTLSRRSRSPRAVVDRDDGTGEADGSRFLGTQERVPDPARPAAEPAPEELRHRLVEIEDHRDADQPQRQRREHQEVRQRVDLDEPVAPPGVGAGQRERGAHEERHVFDEVGAEAGSLVALDVEPADAHAVDDLADRIVRPAEREDVDLAPGRRQGLGLAPDPGILLVIGVGDHGDRSWRGGRRALVCGCHERWAAYPNGPERMVGSPVVPCWPNECHGGSASQISRAPPSGPDPSASFVRPASRSGTGAD